MQTNLVWQSEVLRFCVNDSDSILVSEKSDSSRIFTISFLEVTRIISLTRVTLSLSVGEGNLSTVLSRYSRFVKTSWLCNKCYKKKQKHPVCFWNTLFSITIGKISWCTYLNENNCLDIKDHVLTSTVKSACLGDGDEYRKTDFF